MGELEQMGDREISVSCMVAYGLWGLSIIVWAVSWVVDDGHLGQLGIMLCGAGVTATIRSYFVAHGRRIRAAIALSASDMQEYGQIRSVH